MRQLSNAWSRLELHANATVDVAALERRPGINGHAAVHAALWKRERMPLRLPHAGQIFAVDEEAQPPELSLREDAGDDVRLAAIRIRVRLEALRSGVVQLDADASAAISFPHRDEPAAVARRQRNVDGVAAVVLARPDEGVGSGDGERLAAKRGQ